MKVRRVVAGIQKGKSVFMEDAEAPHTHTYSSIPGFITSLIWETNRNPSLPEGFNDPIGASSSLLPQFGECKCLKVSFPPDTVFQSTSFDPDAAHAEQQKYLLGLYDCFDPDHPGQHATPTIDFGIVTKGQMILELEDGAVCELTAGDVVVQQGNVHSWRVPGTEPAEIVFILIGAGVEK